jgi:hypothetical protein
VLPRAPAWAYGIALPLFALLAPLPDSPLTSGLHVLVGLTLGWLSMALASTYTPRKIIGRPSGFVDEAIRSQTQ